MTTLLLGVSGMQITHSAGDLACLHHHVGTALQSAGRLLSGKSFPPALFHCVVGCSLSANPLLHRNSIVRAAINISWNSCRRAKEPISDTFRILHLLTQWGFTSFFLLRAPQFAILIALKLNSRQQGKVVEGVNSAERLHLLVCSRYSTSSLEVQPLVEKTDWLHHINLPPGLFLFHFC